MKHVHSNATGSAVSEMAIVDTFTKLIFGEADHYSNRELLIIHAFRMVDSNVVLDSHRDMGQYLRALGVKEMISLVSRVQQELAQGTHVLPDVPGAGSSRPSVLNRRAH